MDRKPIQKLSAIQKLFAPIQKLQFKNYLHGFRNYLRSDAEVAIQKLFRPIQKLRFTNYLHRFGNYLRRFKKLLRLRNCDSEAISPD